MSGRAEGGVGRTGRAPAANYDTHVAWAAVGALSLATLVACALPAFQIATDAYIGAGSEQQTFTYSRKLGLGDLRPWSLVVPAGALALLGLSVAALRRGNLAALAVPAAVVAALGTIAVIDLGGRMNWGDGVGVIGYSKPSGGVVLQPALDDLKADARRSPEGRRPGWVLLSEHGYRARPLAGWRFLALAVPLLAFSARSRPSGCSSVRDRRCSRPLCSACSCWPGSSCGPSASWSEDQRFSSARFSRRW